MNKDTKDSLSGVIVAPDVKEDYLQLFTDVVMTEDKIKAWLKGETEVDGDTVSNVKLILDIIRKEHNEKWNDYLADEVSVTDVPDSLKEDCAKDYISDNPQESCRDAMSYMSSYDIKDVIKDAIDDL